MKEQLAKDIKEAFQKREEAHKVLSTITTWAENSINGEGVSRYSRRGISISSEGVELEGDTLKFYPTDYENDRVGDKPISISLIEFGVITAEDFKIHCENQWKSEREEEKKKYEEQKEKEERRKYEELKNRFETSAKA